MKAFTNSLRYTLRKRMTKPTICNNCSNSITTSATIEKEAVQRSSCSSNSSSIQPTILSTKIEKPLTSLTTPNPTAAFQDLLGLNNNNNNNSNSNNNNNNSNDLSTDLKNTFYQRELPTTLVRFSSNEGKTLFRSAMDAGQAEGFFPLTGNFTTQSEPAFCGPSSLAMVLNALEVDPKRRWKGVWRWYSDELLECCSSQEEMKKNGITFDNFLCLAKCHSEVIAKRAPNFSLEEFEKDILDITSGSDKFMIISFSRKTLGQTGDGHFSPIGAYNPEKKMVLVLDTARYKYPSYWCPIETLYESMNPIDKETGRPRGYFVISYDPEHPPIRICNLPSTASTGTSTSAPSIATTQQQQSDSLTPLSSCNENSAAPPTTLCWSVIAQSFCKRIPENMWLEKPRNLEHVVQLVLKNVPSEFTRILANQSIASSEATNPDDEQSKNKYIRHLLLDTTKSPLYPIVFKSLYPNQPLPELLSTTNSNSDDTIQVDQQAAFATLFILGSPSMIYTSLPRELQDTLTSYRQDEHMTSIVKREVERINHEVKELTKSFCTCGPSAHQ
ncbi:Phytochelatin synthase-domain-containing protein [Cunninghamella echinulata]|nr:Phytochelatin synthase-domain-containing protein [Cunninghamella echinulata]